jgi:DNA-binding NtrC family response regulator
MKRKILIVDDETKMRRVLQISLEEEGYSVREAKNGGEALKKLSEFSFDLVIADMKMPGISGVELLRKYKETDPSVNFIIMTAYGTVQSAVEAMKYGAFDYVLKPFDMDEMKIAVSRALDVKQLKKEKQLQQEEFKDKYAFANIVGKSAGIKGVCDLINQVSDINSNILIYGESGSGKELVARAVHFAGKRADRPFVAVNCAAIPETLLESELFGHVKGAFTGAQGEHTGKFELADGGSLFLDEISAMSPALQANLLRVLETKTFEKVGGIKTISVDVRIIAATNTDLKMNIKEQTFREDLYYRLNVVPINIPPLRERKEDIPLIAEHFVRIYGRELKKNIKGISPECVNILLNYNWPGNVRELQNVIERASVLSKEEIIGPESLPEDIKTGGAADEDFNGLSYSAAKKNIIDSFEKNYFASLLKKTGGNVSEAARIAGIDRKNLYDKLKKTGIDTK